MIIFNAHAIVAGIVILIVLAPLYFLLPDHIVESDFGLILFLGIATVISGITEIGGIRGRLFFLPMWLLGVIGTLAFTFMEYSWTGIASIGGGIVAVIALFLGLFYILDNKKWSNAARKLALAEDINNPGDVRFWEAIDDSFMDPTLKSLTTAMCDHNVKVIQLLENNGLGFEAMSATKEKYQSSALPGNKIDIETEDTQPIVDFIEKMKESFEENKEAVSNS